MKIFISWSGKPSLNVATALRDWLPYIFNGIELFVSSEDIRKGKRWPLEVSRELDVSNFGIVCLTPDNLEAPWLLFESGALSKSLKEASVYTLLVGGLRMGVIEGPLSHFQHTMFEKEDFFKLVKSINEAHGPSKQEEMRLRKIFDKFWDDLESSVSTTTKIDTKPEKKRSSEDMLRELLETTSYIAKNIPDTRKLDFPNEPRPDQLTSKECEFWNQILDKVGKVSPFARGYLADAKGYLSNGTLTIILSDPEVASLVENERNIKLLQKTLSEMGHGDGCKIVFTAIPAPRIPSRVPPPPKK
jgi:TIR domain